MLAYILPVIILAMLALTWISISSSNGIIENQISSRMTAELSSQIGTMGEYMDSISNMATTISRVVATNHDGVEMKKYEEMLAEIIKDNELALGSGLWYEPYAFKADEEFMGPYVYKDGDDIAVTYDYSNAEYNYFEQEYYLIAKEADQAQFTDPYYDPVSDTIMSSCTMPIIRGGKFIGCVTVDIELTTIKELIDSVRVGEKGTAMLLTGDGTYIAGVDDKKIQNAEQISSESNKSLVTAGKEILKNENGKTTYKTSKDTVNLYYATLASTGWKLVIQMPQSELDEPVHRLAILLIIVCVIAVAASIIMVLLQVSSISKSITKVQQFASSLADGDFSVEPLHVKSKDELGVMGDSLNEMYGSNKDVIGNIAKHSLAIKDSSQHLKKVSSDLAGKFKEIQDFMNNVNQAMMNTSAATEEVNASTEEVLSNVNLLAEETADSMKIAREIRVRAGDVGDNSKKAYDSATKLSEAFERKLNISIENAKVVANISEMADVISDIAGQINLLSLNASIEAARAGEAGKGFAVVATEIGSLAGSTAEAVETIQKTISEVRDAFSGLSEDAKGLLKFLQENVMPDYNNFVEVALQYGNDAETIARSSDNISEKTEQIKCIMDEVTYAIQSIAEATQETTDISSQIMGSIDLVSDDVTQVSKMSEEQENIVTDLNIVVDKFKLE